MEVLRKRTLKCLSVVEKLAQVQDSDFFSLRRSGYCVWIRFFQEVEEF